MTPSKDDRPRHRFPVVTVVLLSLNVGIFLLVGRPFDEQIDRALSYEYAAVPCEVVTGRPLSVTELAATGNGDTEACERGSTGEVPAFPGKQVFLAVVSSMFLHADLVHLAGNMLFLWIFARGLEGRLGPALFLALYLLAGVVAAAAQVLFEPSSTVPIVGASGAIAGVMGAYLVLLPHEPIRSRALFFLPPRGIPAPWLLALWFVLQFVSDRSDEVAWVAHLAGFAFGALIGLLLRRSGRVSRPASAR